MNHTTTCNKVGLDVKIYSLSEKAEIIEQATDVEDVTHETTFVGDVPMEQEIEDIGGKVYTNTMYDMPPELQRPVMFNLTPWSSNQPRNENIASLRFPSTIFDKVQNLRMRLANRSLFACDISVKVYVQSVAKQAGALVMAMSPMSKKPANVYEAMSGPHVILNAGEHVSGEIVVPYLRDTRSMVVRSYGTNLEDKLFDFLEMNLLVLSPLKVTDATSVKLVCVAQILNPVYTGSGYVDIPVVNQGKKASAVSSSGGPAKTTTKPVPQRGDSGKDKEGKPTKPEQYAKAAANTLATIAGAAVTVAKIVGTGLEIAAMVGLSKPMVEHKITPVGSVLDLFGPNTDGQFCAYQMGAYQDTKNIAHPLLFGKEDPMEISNIAKRPGLAGIFEWKDTDNAGNVIATIPITPGCVSLKNNERANHTPLSLLSTLFRRWRGKINMRIRLFSTKFHAGQLEIIANYGSPGSVNSEGKAACCHRCVLDIANNNMVELELGFYYNSPVEETIIAPFGTAFPDCVFIRTLSELNATADVTPTIEGTVEIWSEDIQFGVPGLSTLQLTPAVVNQGIFEDSLLHSIEDGKVKLCDDWDVNLKIWDRFVSGEDIHSLRQVTRRLMPVNDGAVTVINGFAPMSLYETNKWVEAAQSLFVFQIGGWRMALYRDGTTITYADKPIGYDEGLHGYATIYARDSLLHEPVMMNLPNMFKYGVWILGNTSLQYDKSFLLHTDPANKKWVVHMALADDASWGGLNYIKYDRIYAFEPQTPSDIGDVL